jgi:hypothetical protein
MFFCSAINNIILKKANLSEALIKALFGLLLHGNNFSLKKASGPNQETIMKI